jgi:hypothetical protein
MIGWSRSKPAAWAVGWRVVIAGTEAQSGGRSPVLDVRRREFITLLGGAAAAWPLAARAQLADRIARIGYIGPDRTAPLAAAIYQAFLDEMQIHGFKNGQNLVVEFRRLEQDLRALSVDAAELVRLNVDVLFADGTEAALQAAVSASRTLD